MGAETPEAEADDDEEQPLVEAVPEPFKEACVEVQAQKDKPVPPQHGVVVLHAEPYGGTGRRSEKERPVEQFHMAGLVP